MVILSLIFYRNFLKLCLILLVVVLSLEKLSASVSVEVNLPVSSLQHRRITPTPLNEQSNNKSLFRKYHLIDICVLLMEAIA